MRHFLIKGFIVSVLLLSAIAKLLDFNNVVLLLNSSFKFSLVMREIIIGFSIVLEIAVAVIIWMGIYNLWLIYYGIICLFISFIGINLLLIIFEVDNCGCFGTFMSVHPGISLIKSILLLLIFIYLRHKKIVSKYLET